MTCERICLFGEVLFDHFPDGKQVLGGAPFNVAWHLQALSQSPLFISRVGADPEGEQIRRSMQDWGMELDGLQTDPALPTGRVSVSLHDGEPAYDIVQPCAYDAIAAPDPTPDCGLLYHGSLALRSARSNAALELLRGGSPRTVFLDVNLRPPWWQPQRIRDLLHAAHWVKLNSDELAQLHPMAEQSESAALDFLGAYDLTGLVLTRGAAGARILTRQGESFSVSPDRGIRVVDTVGAGDAFASIVILGLVNDWPLDVTLQRAQAFASLLVGNRGATVRDPAFYQPFIDQWNLGA